MATLCGWASIDERGKISGGAAGDQKQRSSASDTTGEVRVGNWYHFGQTYVLRYKDRMKAKKHAAALKFFCNSVLVGYDQSQRTSLYTAVKTLGFANYTKLAAAKECDCSSLQDLCAMIAGANITSNPATSGMLNIFKASGDFEVLTDRKYLTSGDYLMEGDISVKPGKHTIGTITDGSKAFTVNYTYKDFIKEIQTAIGAKVDGIAGNETLSKTITVSKSKNNRHAVVKPLQKYFNSAGYPCGTADGIAGAKFDTAVKAFQKANGCTVDGEITARAATWKKLLKLS